MGITLDDLNAQRAMLARGEEKRKAAKQAEERERLRDTFAAAALTGLLSNDSFFRGDDAAKRCYDYADAMLRERSRTDKAVTRPGDGTGDTPSDDEIDALEFVVVNGHTASDSDYVILRQWLIRLRPEFDRSEPIANVPDADSRVWETPAETNPTPIRNGTPAEGSVHGEGTVGERLAERVLITQAILDDNERLRAENARLREAIRRLADQDATLSVCEGSVTVTLDATLTEAEHDALEFAVETGRVAIHDDAILRKLLERLNHDAVPEAIAAEPESSVPPGSVAAPANTLTLTVEEREAIEWCLSLPMLDRDAVRMMPLRKLLERLHT